MKIRWIGFSSRVFGATARMAPSVANARAERRNDVALPEGELHICQRRIRSFQRLLTDSKCNARRILDGGQIRPEQPVDEHRPISIQMSKRSADRRFDADIRRHRVERPAKRMDLRHERAQVGVFPFLNAAVGTPSIVNASSARSLQARTAAERAPGSLPETLA